MVALTNFWGDWVSTFIKQQKLKYKKEGVLLYSKMPFIHNS
jgi:hypothetical protein